MLSTYKYKIILKKQNLGNFIKNVGQWDKLPKCRTNVGQNCKMWEMWECGTSVQPGYKSFKSFRVTLVDASTSSPS